jgi:excinuclease ABC subunit C
VARVYAAKMLPLDRQVVFDPARLEEFLAATPPRPAVVRIEPRTDLPGARPLLLRTADLRRRLRLLFGPPEPGSKRVNLREYAAGIRFRLTGSAFEQAFVSWQHARALWPNAYRDRLKLRPPALIKMNATSAYPRLYVTRRISPTGLFFGPFASRPFADSFLHALLDLFRMRRCQIKIRRDPSFPGCIYSEMKMCLAPCFAGCTADEYTTEAGRVAGFLNTRGASLSEEFSRDRETASAQLDFERAAALHRRIEKVDALRRTLPDLARRLEELDAVILERGAAENTVAFFAVRVGRIADPFLLRFDVLASQPRSAEDLLRGALQPNTNEGHVNDSSQLGKAPADRATGEIEARSNGAAEREDHLALLARWFYGRPREGEIFYLEGKSDTWPYRRILRACARVLAPREGPTPS